MEYKNVFFCWHIYLYQESGMVVLFSKDFSKVTPKQLSIKNEKNLFGIVSDSQTVDYPNSITGCSTRAFRLL